MKFLVHKYQINVVNGFRRAQTMIKVGNIIWIVSCIIMVIIAASTFASAAETKEAADSNFIFIAVPIFGIGIGLIVVSLGRMARYLFGYYCQFGGTKLFTGCYIIAAKEEYRLEKWWWGNCSPSDSLRQMYTSESRI